MTAQIDDEFYDRADAHIQLANEQLSRTAARGTVSASFMYGVARFNAWICACGRKDAQEMGESKAESIDYFVAQYRKMLEENFDDYIEHFDRYMKSSGNQKG